MPSDLEPFTASHPGERVNCLPLDSGSEDHVFDPPALCADEVMMVVLAEIFGQLEPSMSCNLDAMNHPSLFEDHEAAIHRRLREGSIRGANLGNRQRRLRLREDVDNAAPRRGRALADGREPSFRAITHSSHAGTLSRMSLSPLDG